MDSDVLGSGKYGEHAEHGCWKIKAIHVFGGVPREFTVLPICFVKQAKFSSKFGAYRTPAKDPERLVLFPVSERLRLSNRSDDASFTIGTLTICGTSAPYQSQCCSKNITSEFRVASAYRGLHDGPGLRRSG